MEHMRLLLAIFLTIMVFLLWELLFVPGQPVQPPEQSGQSRSAESVSDDRASEPRPDSRQTGKSDQTPAELPSQSFGSIVVENNLYRAEISEKGAAIRRFVLSQYRQSMDEDSPRKQLVPESNSVGTALIRFAGSGLDSPEQAVFTTDSDGDHLRVTDQPETLSFYWQSSQGLVIEKQYVFYPDSYKIGLNVHLVNDGSAPLAPEMILEMTNPRPDGGTFVFEGPFAYVDGSLEEVKPKNLDEEQSFSGKIRWAGIEDRYFMTALVPENPGEKRIRMNEDTDRQVLRVSYIEPMERLDAGAGQSYAYHLFMGPKRMSELKAFGYELDKAINFGFFDIIAKPCLYLMNKIHEFGVANYGVAIILLTILFKVIFWPLGNKSYRSMAEMKKLQPLMADIRKKYKDDKKKMNEEVMRLYKTYKVNPMSGCLPMVVQIPVFIAFYRMLYEAIELRHAPFFLWINDLSSPDRLFRFDISIPLMAPPYGIPVLTIIMGATMFLQQKLSPPPGDPSQARIMMMLPLVFTVIFVNFPSGLVLYWLTNNVLSIAQQYYVTRKTV